MCLAKLQQKKHLKLLRLRTNINLGRYNQLRLCRLFYSHLIKMPHVAKILDEPIAFFEKVVYNVSNKSAVCGKNIRWRLLWRLKEMFI